MQLWSSLQELHTFINTVTNHSRTILWWCFFFLVFFSFFLFFLYLFRAVTVHVLIHDEVDSFLDDLCSMDAPWAKNKIIIIIKQYPLYPCACVMIIIMCVRDTYNKSLFKGNDSYSLNILYVTHSCLPGLIMVLHHFLARMLSIYTLFN